MEEGESKKGEIGRMGSKGKKQRHSQTDFSEIVKKAYDMGISDRSVTVQKILDELKSDLMKMKAN